MEDAEDVLQVTAQLMPPPRQVSTGIRAASLNSAAVPGDREASQAASTSNTDDPETDFQEIAVKALKDVRLLKSQLREQVEHSLYAS